MAAKTYRKLIPNPIGLGKGKEVREEVFTDEGFSDEHKSKLKAAIKAKRVKEVSSDELETIETPIDVEALQSQLEEATKRAEAAEAKVAELEEALANQGGEEGECSEGTDDTTSTSRRSKIAGK
jgi:macrodomain Ter protein organizer (MatP/YcbG family)